MTLPIQPVLMCGGSGTRLWPLSREATPKQFAEFGTEESLLQRTARRVQALFGQPMLAVCGEAHRFQVQGQLEAFPLQAVFSEPVARNTAAAIAVACLAKAAENPVMALVPCDHDMPDLGSLSLAMAEAYALADEGWLVMLGIQPTYPATGYGYIQCGAAIATQQARALPTGRVAAAMKEKPDAETAGYFMRDGYLWNSGLLVFRARTLLAEMARLCPEVVEAAQAALLAGTCNGNAALLDAAAYAKSPNISLDYAVLEKTPRKACVPYDGKWSDLGSWASIAQLYAQDDRGNAVAGDAMALNCDNSLVLSTKRLVVAQGVQNIAVIETADAVYVTDLRDSERTKEAVDALKQARRQEVKLPARVYRPWGWYESLTMDEGHQSKRLHVNAGASISLQYHHFRSEHWVIVKGTAVVVRGEETLTLKPGESVFIPATFVHRLTALDEPVEVLEVQTGTYFGEDDIVRLEDQYARIERKD